MKIGFICTGNSARSQMAEGFAKEIANKLGLKLEVFSAGSKPASEVNPLSVEVMAEKGIDISCQKPKNLESIPYSELDLVVTLCDSAKNSCPTVPGKKMIHWDLQDPADFEGSLEKKRELFRKVRDEIEERMWDLLQSLQLRQ